MPSLYDAGWLNAERTGALARMDYREAQDLADIQSLQSLFSDSLEPVLPAVNYVGA